jgi:hypothetical protein
MRLLSRVTARFWWLRMRHHEARAARQLLRNLA